MWAIVTIKLPRDPKHNPHNKITGECVCSDVCTDVTGSHHSLIMSGVDIHKISDVAKGLYGHTTRVEIIPYRMLQKIRGEI